MSDKYAAITAHADRYPMHLMCAALGVSVSGYYAAVQRASAPPTVRAVAQTRRRLVVRAMFVRCRQRYGAPRLVRELRETGVRISQKSVAKILREEGLAARRPTPFASTTDSTHADPMADNVLARRFALTFGSASTQRCSPFGGHLHDFHFGFRKISVHSSPCAVLQLSTRSCGCVPRGFSLTRLLLTLQPRKCV